MAKQQPTLQQVLAQFEQDAFDGNLNTDSLPPAGSPINALRAQMALFIETAKEIRNLTKMYQQEVRESLNKIETQMFVLGEKVADIEQYIKLKENPIVETEEVYEGEIPDGY